MQLTTEERRLADERLAERTAAGDEDAFAELYERYFQGVYDFVLRLVRDRDTAADVVQNTFVKAWEALREGRVTNVKAWLYTVAHNGAMDELRRRSRLASGEDAEEAAFAQVDPSRFTNPEAVARDRELVELVWASAAALNPQEYGLLDLHLRQGFEAPELADALGLERGAVYTRLSRLRDSFEEAVTTTLLLRRGRNECEDLDALLVEHGSSAPTRETRQLVARHLEECETCKEQKKRIVSPAAILAGLAIVPAPLALKNSIWVGVSGSTVARPEASASAAGASSTGAGAGAGAGAVAAGHVTALGLKAAVVAGLAVAVGAAGIAGIVVVRATSGDGGDRGAAGAGVAAVEDPVDVHSTSHEVGEPTGEGEIAVAWTPSTDATGYSIEWSEGASALPDEVVDLPASADGAERIVGPGSWWFNLRTRDENGLWTHTVHLGPFIVSAPPDTSIEGGPSGVVATPRASFELVSDAEDATFECSLDDARFKPCESPKEFNGVDQGRHRFRVRAINAAGQVDETPARRVWRVDLEPPTVDITEAATATTSLQATFRFVANEEGSTYECRLDGGAFTACASPTSYGGLDQGDHTFAVRATDEAGNTGDPVSHGWHVDTVPPDTTIVSGPSGAVGTAEARFAFTSEPGAEFLCRLGGRPFEPCSSPKAYDGLDLGEHRFQVVARDAAGNQDPTPASRSWTVVDRSPPETSITSGPPDLFASSEVEFAFSSSEPHSTFRCRLDGGDWRACASPQSYAKLEDGGHTFAVQATDKAGNTDPTPATRSFIVDTIPPDTKLVTVPPQGGTGGKGETFEFVATEKEATFECSLDGAEFAACVSPTTYFDLKEGGHFFGVRAVDPAGNRDPTPAEYKWEIRVSQPVP
jgi:RNA polymerase sigma factor (sigma-70 family)